ncbi:MAG: 2-amino-4-hydroxy-6-hydroxymethyldihydropteridine diphosphokinase [Chitinophagaceae bacterium]
MNTVYLLTGGNVGNRQQYLQESVRLIEATCGKIINRSAIYETAAWGKTDQAAFLNQALELSTLLAPAALMKQLLAIEHAAGRKRAEKYGPRTIDIDILLFNSEVIQTPLLTVPHAQMANRRFVLEPLNEIAPAYIHPLLKKNITQLLQVCPDPLPVKKFSAI